MYRLLLSSTTDARWPFRGVYVSLTSPPEMLKSGLHTAASADATTPSRTIASSRTGRRRPGVRAKLMMNLQRNAKAGDPRPPAFTLLLHTFSARRYFNRVALNEADSTEPP